MTITATFTDPFFTGGGLSALVPAVYPVAINGRPYMIDEKPETYLAAWQHETIPLLRAQSDDSSSPAERSLNPQGLWRRAQDSWHHGAGQVYRDRDEAADPYRFRSSKGVDPWTRYQFSPLPDTAISKSGAGTNQFVVTTGTRAYFADENDLYWSTDLVSWTAVTGYTGGTITSITSDGFNVYFTDGVDIWTTNQGTGAATDADNTNATLLRYVKGRLMVAVGSELQNIPVLNAAATMTYTHLNTAFTWVDCCEGNGHIYAAGFSGDKSVIYRTAVKADGTALDLPIAAGALPDGEIVRAIQGYLGFIWIGSDLGVRFAEVNTQGDLTIGPLIETPAAVKAFEAQARFMWFGWTAYDAVSTGLGRMDLTEFVGIDQPAYASDLMVTGQGAVTSIATFLEKRIFTVSGAGIYQQDTDLVASGTIDCGQVSFGLPDLKTAVFLDVATEPLVGAYTAALSVDGGEFIQVGVETTAGDTSDTFPTNQETGERFEVRLSFTSGATGPTITRWTLKAMPSANDGPAEIFSIPLILADPLLIKGNEYPCNVQFELAEISALRQTREIVTLQLLDDSYTGILSDFTWFPYGLTDESDGMWGMKGTCQIKFQRIT